ncbi:MAG: SIS domain-containing protein, partial [Planctomycetota bacterium]
MDIKYARNVLRSEMAAIKSLIPLINKKFQDAAKLILACKGRIVVTGMGKTGLIGQKISATLASTGTPSLFLHPAEAYHGDLGRVVKDDIVLALSNSGETEEVIRLIPTLKKIGVKIVVITCSKDSPLG